MARTRTIDAAGQTPQPPACALPHHEPGQRVQFHRWDRDAAAMVTITGTVERHVSRTLTIRTDVHGTILTSCGHVIGAAS